MPSQATEFESCLARHCAHRIQPWVRSTDRILEFGGTTDLNLREVVAAEKVRLSFDELTKRDPKRQPTDVIFCSEVLEYLPDPAETLEKLKELLKPGGLLIVFALYDEAFKHPDTKATALHLYSWNVQTLGNLLLDCGYQFVSGAVERTENEATARSLARRWKLGEPAFAWVLRATRIFAPRHLVRVVGRKPS